jgi:hypothetical protein
VASKTKKSKKPTRAQVRSFLEAVGWFVTTFSIMENKVRETLRHFTGVTPAVAASVFSGTRTNEALGHLKRIAEATNWAEDRQKLLNHIASQLGEITQLRNDLLHYGVTGNHPDDIVVTNEKYAHVERRIRATKLSAAILKQASTDLLFMLPWLSILEGHVVPFPVEMDEFGKGFNKAFPAALLKWEWQYKPERVDRSKQTAHELPPKEPRPTRPR